MVPLQSIPTCYYVFVSEAGLSPSSAPPITWLCNYGRVALLTCTQTVPLVIVMLPSVLETTVLPMMLLGQRAEIPKELFLTVVLLVTVPFGAEIPLAH